MNSPNRSSNTSVKEAAKSKPGPPRRRRALLERGMAETVIGGALVGVLQDLIGLAEFLEFVLGRVVAGIAVGMMFLGERAIGDLHLLGGAGARNAKDLVIVPLAHANPPATEDSAAVTSKPSASPEIIHAPPRE